MPTERTGNLANLQRLSISLLASFTIVALALVFWSVWRSAALAARADNPRQVEAALRTQRGRIVAADGTVLAETDGTAARRRRSYPAPYAGPAVGYYSFRFGTAGVEAGLDDVLRGSEQAPLAQWWRQLLNRPPAGRDVRVTLDVARQQQATSLMAGRQGALVLLDLGAADAAGSAAVLAMVSLPGYDPNVLESEFEQLVNDDSAPLLNRVTQAQYQPGLVLTPFVLATAIEQGVVDLAAPVTNPHRPIPVDGDVSRCATRPPEEATWEDVVAASCPGPLQDVGLALGADGLQLMMERFGFLSAPALPLNTAAPAPVPVSDVALAAVGQGELTVTPLQVALALGALARDGRLPAPQLVAALQSGDGSWQPTPSPEVQAQAVTAQAALEVRALLPQSEQAHELALLVLSGPDAATNAWYLAMAPAVSARYVLVVVTENSGNVAETADIGRALLRGLAP